jgi:hypothetical protein
MIIEILNKIANTQGSIAKKAVLEENADNMLLRTVFYNALSPRVKFWIKKIPIYARSEKNMSLEWAIDQLSFLADRIKTGKEGSDHLAWILGSVSEGDAQVIIKIIQKDLKIGFNISSTNKVIPGLIEVTPYMGATPFNNKDAQDLCKDRIYSQVKMDGRYCNGIVKDGKALLLSRGGEITYVGNAKFLRELAECPDMVLNGELTITGIDRYTANGIISSIVDINKKIGERSADQTAKKIAEFEKERGPYQEMLDRITFTVWDMVTLDEYEDMSSTVPYFKRLEFLQEYIKDNNLKQIAEVEWKFVHSFKEAMDHFQEVLARGDEGTIIKTFDGEWKKGKPKWQMKMKKEDYHDLKAVSFNYGTVGTKNEHVISSVNVESECGRIKTKAGGMTEEDMKYVTENQDEVRGKIIETKCSGLSQNKHGEWALLHPVYIKIRDDKTIANSLEECIAINNMINELN